MILADKDCNIFDKLPAGVSFKNIPPFHLSKGNFTKEEVVLKFEEAGFMLKELMKELKTMTS